MSNLQPSAAEVLLERLSDKVCSQDKDNKALKLWLDISKVAVPAVYQAAINGNVICMDAVREMETIRQKHDR